MTTAQVTVVTILGQANVTVWGDGGWGVDALLGQQTREHDDLDLVVPADAVPLIRRLLDAAGFVVERDWLPTVLAMRHQDGRAVDSHPIESAADGRRRPDPARRRPTVALQRAGDWAHRE